VTKLKKYNFSKLPSQFYFRSKTHNVNKNICVNLSETVKNPYLEHKLQKMIFRFKGQHD